MVILFSRGIPLFIKYIAISLLFVLILSSGIVYSASNDALEQPKKEDIPLEPALRGVLSIKIGVVDIQRVIAESKKGIEARRYYEGLASLRSEEELARTEQELVGQLIQDIDSIIEEYAKEKGFSLIIDTLEGGIIYVDDEFDVTDKIIELYDKKVGVSEPERK